MMHMIQFVLQKIVIKYLNKHQLPIIYNGLIKAVESGKKIFCKNILMPS